MEFEQGDNVVVDYYSNKITKKLLATFIRDYGTCIQLMDKMGQGVTIQKEDIIKIEMRK